MTWFQKLTGIEESTPEAVREKLQVDGKLLTSVSSQNVYRCGVLEIPSLSDLRQRVDHVDVLAGRIKVREVVADVQKLHADEVNTGALFQVASQFNLLEMVSPDRTPEEGVGIYEHDRTQGPACAIACGAGTIYRNYFVPVNGKIGQPKTLGERSGAIWGEHSPTSCLPLRTGPEKDDT